MNKRNKYWIVLRVALVIVIIVYIFIPRMKTSVDNVLFDHMNINEITEVRISKSPDYQDYVVQDKKVITELIKGLSEIEIRKSKINKYEEAYWIYISTDNGRGYLINLYDDKYISIFNPDQTKNELNAYKIISDYDLEPILKLIEKSI